MHKKIRCVGEKKLLERNITIPFKNRIKDRPLLSAYILLGATHPFLSLAS